MRRRMFIENLLAAGLAAQAVPVKSAPNHEWPDSDLLGVSPDGKTICLSSGAPRSLSASLTRFGWNSKWDKPGVTATVDFVRLEDFEIAYSLQVSSIPTRAIFSPDSTHVWMHGAAHKGGSRQLYQIDLKRNATTVVPRGPDSPFFEILVANDRGITYEIELGPGAIKGGRWAVRELTGAIVHSASVVPEGAPNRYTSAAWPTYSSDRSILAHAVGDEIILRNCNDFSIRWMKSVGSRGWGIRSLSLSADGGWLAALVIESNFNLKDRRARVVILDAETGAEKSMFPVRSFDLVALSADGATAAVAIRSRTKNTVEEYSLDIDIHAAADGRIVSRLEHDVVSHAQDAMATYVGQRMLQFTSDGQYLLSTGRKTKLWKAPRA